MIEKHLLIEKRNQKQKELNLQDQIQLIESENQALRDTLAKTQKRLQNAQRQIKSQTQQK